VLFQISSSKLKITTSRRFHVSFPKHIYPFQFALLGLHNNALPVPNELIWYATIIGQLPFRAIIVCLPAKMLELTGPSVNYAERKAKLQQASRE
jgi:hypothetical protein